MSYVRSTFKFSVLAKTNPMNHMEQGLLDWGAAGDVVMSLIGGGIWGKPWKHSGLTCASTICWLRSNVPIKCLTFDSIRPHHSNWSSQLFELARRTIKCLKKLKKKKKYLSPNNLLN